MGKIIRYARYVGFGLCVAWGFLLFSVQEFTPAESLPPFVVSTVPGCVACIAMLFLLHPRFVAGRTPFAFMAASLAALGTLLHVLPELQGLGMGSCGVVLGGASFVGLLAAWFFSYAHLPSREVVACSGASLIVAACACVVVSRCSYTVASFIMAALPLAAATLLPVPESFSSGLHTQKRRSFDVASVFARMPWRTYLGVALLSFVVDGIRSIGRLPGSFFGRADWTFLVIPVAAGLALMAVVLIRVRRFDLGFATKSVILLFALSVALILATSGSNYLLGFVASLCVQALCWMLLVFAAKQCSGCELPLFCIGWIAQLAGGMCAMLLFSSVAGWETVALFVLLFAMALAVAFVFADKRFIVALDDEAEDEESARAEAGLGAEGVRASDCEKDAVAAKEEDEVGRIDCFCECYGLTAREHEVFALWIAGRDMRYIQEELVVAQGTVKSHIRNIYEKCDVHNRHDLVRKFESFE